LEQNRHRQQDQRRTEHQGDEEVRARHGDAIARHEYVQYAVVHLHRDVERRWPCADLEVARPADLLGDDFVEGYVDCGLLVHVLGRNDVHTGTNLNS